MQLLRVRGSRAGAENPHKPHTGSPAETARKRPNLSRSLAPGPRCSVRTQPAGTAGRGDRSGATALPQDPHRTHQFAKQQLITNTCSTRVCAGGAELQNQHTLSTPPLGATEPGKRSLVPSSSLRPQGLCQHRSLGQAALPVQRRQGRRLAAWGQGCHHGILLPDPPAAPCCQKQDLSAPETPIYSTMICTLLSGCSFSCS